MCAAGCSNAADDVDKDNTILPKESTPSRSIDVDLTVLSSTMVYAEVYHMVESPDEYLGKTIKMNGPYVSSFYDETNQYYHFIIIEDATACCQSGLEFKLSGDHNYPDDYPEEMDKIEVVGVFNTYKELGLSYYFIEVDEISVLA